MNTKRTLQYVLLLVLCFLAGCGAALALHIIDARNEAITPISGGQTIDFTEYGFTLTVPDGYSLANYTANNHAEGGTALFSGCAFLEQNELYIYCYANENGDQLSDYTEKELVSYYMQAGAQDVRLRTLGGRRFLDYTAAVQNGNQIEIWRTYETWDSTHQVVFETRMSADDALPILATLTFTE
ncbi:MAG: hypothetical protein J6M47_07370 [Clostridia bacterium]|nr:hypothetical protein [Clostridia bacterium]